MICLSYCHSYGKYGSGEHMDFPFTHLVIAILLSRPLGGSAAVTPSPITLQCPVPEAVVGTQ